MAILKYECGFCKSKSEFIAYDRYDNDAIFDRFQKHIDICEIKILTHEKEKQIDKIKDDHAQ